MSSYIILRDIPKEEVRIDLRTFKITGGFRGFQLAPEGIHYVSVLMGSRYCGFWCFTTPNLPIVKIFEYEEKVFKDDSPQSTAQYREMALSQAMDKTLIIYPMEQQEIWGKLTKHIRDDNLFKTFSNDARPVPPAGLPASEMAEWMLNNQKSRFELAFYETHKSDISSFLAEFQSAFLRGAIPAEQNQDTEAFGRWRHLLLSVYNAGQSEIEDLPDLFISIIDIIKAQFELLPFELFKDNSFIIKDAKKLCEDMIDTEIREAVEKGRELDDYLSSRRKL